MGRVPDTPQEEQEEEQSLEKDELSNPKKK